ncbi:hypothetical protein QQF64_029828 [Cirrhinus molitorella]|uniref:Integrase catalytic domain-containing protein n=1 Tax=Cirrhinus molitorella TaxID=172907 RepID=A0ABR3N1K6_9TELE
MKKHSPEVNFGPGIIHCFEELKIAGVNKIPCHQSMSLRQQYLTVFNSNSRARRELSNNNQDNLLSSTRRLFRRQVQRLHSRRGRPAIKITRDQIEFLMKQGHTSEECLECWGALIISVQEIKAACVVPIRSRMAAVDEAELENVVRRLQREFPNSGNEIMRALLIAEGLRVSRQRVREMLVRINPAAAARRWSSTVARRVYHVPYPNSLWHIDGNMRLIRWGFVIHGAIDGHSRLITYLNCNTDNCSSTVLSQFIQATCLYGIPSRVRSDHGGESLQVALFMNLVLGLQRRSHITGETVHNQRIERLWRDVFLHVLQPFYIFYTLENSELLEPNNDIHKVSLRIVFLPQIQAKLQHFKEAWNHHALRTENNKTPTQIWTEGMLSRIETDSIAINNVFGDNLYRPENLDALLAQHGIESLPTAENQEIPAVIVDNLNKPHPATTGDCFAYN